ncbi:hypothetical protein OF83DRAFT_1180416 [Amylostereum chailletii]|nr:hypothetical protein OF83DRAFT_1180416 [Amylostereum chailletii]
MSSTLASSSRNLSTTNCTPPTTPPPSPVLSRTPTPDPRVPSAHAPSSPQAATTSNVDPVKEMSVLINKMKKLGKEEREEAAAMLKGLAGSLDF